jgi:hypothetical protein
MNQQGLTGGQIGGVGFGQQIPHTSTMNQQDLTRCNIGGSGFGQQIPQSTMMNQQGLTGGNLGGSYSQQIPQNTSSQLGGQMGSQLEGGQMGTQMGTQMGSQMGTNYCQIPQQQCYETFKTVEPSLTSMQYSNIGTTQGLGQNVGGQSLINDPTRGGTIIDESYHKTTDLKRGYNY